MQYKHLGRSGPKVSRLALGTMNFGMVTDEPASFLIMDEALEHGRAAQAGRRRANRCLALSSRAILPLGTALAEEVIFRGSLLGLFTQRHRPAVAASMSSILFGMWHVLPTLRTLPLNPAGARVHGNPMRTAGAVLATVTATTLAGYGLAWLRFRSASIAAPVVAHASLNTAAYLAARFVAGAAAPQRIVTAHQAVRAPLGPARPR